MLFNWLGFKRHKRQAPTLKAIFVATSAGEPMRSVNATETISNRGLQGDRYSEDRGHWKSIDGCQVTLITEHDLTQAKKGTEAKFQQALDNGSHRRNLVIAGIKTKNLEGRKFRIGTAIFRYDKPRPPCAYLDKITGKGMCRALSHNSGVCLRVVGGGKLAVGDTIEIIDQT
ncbi:MOSC domain-containing protein [Sulfuricaulis sp.]|jgi:MOSC domain-containing protein YiiM|uniref:MOSC domain-containing protein n=1 Tax=Sulfuricaulis sp. TaxID=2003553 RepID=UPI003559DAED